ncbi:MAG: Uma2 family endonuclease, partial [Actinomycetota bacterium]|nr:Uma2 family endonuclease [Actinomycetota bacterium]
MSSMRWPDHLLTLDEWDALPEQESGRFELVEGVLQVSPQSTSPHQIASLMLGTQLTAALRPHGWIPIPEIDVVLVESFPPVVR